MLFILLQLRGVENRIRIVLSCIDQASGLDLGSKHNKTGYGTDPGVGKAFGQSWTSVAEPPHLVLCRNQNESMSPNNRKYAKMHGILCIYFFRQEPRLALTCAIRI